MKKVTFILIIFALISSCAERKSSSTNTDKSDIKQQEVTAKENTLEKAIITTIKAHQNKDEKTLNELVLKDFGIAFLHIPGAMPQYYISDKISFEKSESEYFPFDNIAPKSYEIKFEELPYYDCGTEAWTKSPGIYCDTTNVCTQLSTIAKDLKLYANRNIPEEEIKKYEEIEKISHKIVVLDDKGNFFKFFLTLKNNKWYLTIIDRTDYCSA